MSRPLTNRGTLEDDELRTWLWEAAPVPDTDDPLERLYAAPSAQPRHDAI